jgi:hypothetical protein
MVTDAMVDAGKRIASLSKATRALGFPASDP